MPYAIDLMHHHSHNHLFVLPALLVSAFILTGCGTAAPRQESVQFSTLNDSFQQESSSDAPATPPSSTAAPLATPLSTTSSNVLGKTTMKQLSDFTPIEGSIVTMETNKGAIVFELFRDKAPLTTLNFLTLAKSGFYDGIVFHRVIPDFMAQVGDPLTRDPSKQALWGTGSAGYTIPDEFSPELKHDSEGIVSMANSGPNTGSSQIFITYGPTPWLDGKHAVFGKVTSGMDVLRQLTNGDKIVNVTFK